MSPVERINALTTNARNTWFVLLAALVFVGITLMSVEHIDFYGVDRATTLPLVNVDVPTNYFFYAAPILTAAVYCYFHLYLIRLWDMLSIRAPKVEGQPLGDLISPWLITDAALYLRADRRDEKNMVVPHRLLDGTAMALNFGIAWGFGWIVLGYLFWLSLAARDGWMTSIAAISLMTSLFVGLTSYALMRRRMSSPVPTRQEHVFREFPWLWSLVPLAFVTIGGGVLVTEGPTRWLAPLDMTGEAIVERPEGWTPYRLAKIDFRDQWCKRAENTCDTSGLSPEQENAIESEWDDRRAIALTDLNAPGWSAPDKSPPDLRNAQLSQTFLSGADLSRAQMEGATLFGAQMEGATLFGAQMEGANLRRAQMEGATLRRAQMERANLIAAQMEGADLFRAQMEGANLIAAQMEGADLSRAQMEGATLSGAQMEGADLFRAQMEGARLGYTHLTGTPQTPNLLQSTNLNASTNDGGALRFVDLTTVEFDAQTDFRNAFLDGTVVLTDAFRAQMGNPCQWTAERLPDAEFYGRWRGWVEAGPDPWAFYPPDQWRDVTPIPPDPGCAWKTGPIVPEPGTDP